MQRDIILINEDLCNGCGLCVPGCPEGALQIIDGKVRLVSDLFCDGLGACIGECPEDAIKIEKREAEPYEEETVMANIIKHGEGTVLAHLVHLRDHNETEFLNIALGYLEKNNINVPEGFTKENEPSKSPTMACGCPGSMEQELKPSQTGSSDTVSGPVASELSQWPIQMHLINPNAPYFKDANLVISADCVPFSYPNFHNEFLKGKKLIILCPKLDSGIDEYIEKLKELFKNQNIKSLDIVHMEVPCCFGIGQIVKKALQEAEVNIPVNDVTISVNGEISGN